MKKAIIILSAAAAISFVAPTDPPAKNAATVNMHSGLYIFLESRPTAPFEILGTVKKGGFVWSGKATEMMDIMTRRTHKQYPDAEGIIFDDITMDHATVIKFK